MKVLITGADGMLGSNLARELLTRGHEVRAFLLSGSPAISLQGLPIERVEGNILQKEHLDAAMDGCDAMIHAAANTNIWPYRSELVRKVNIEGTKNIIAAAKEASLKRVVYIGTANSFGFGPKHAPGDETKPYSSAKYGLDYMDSKRTAQLLLLKEVQENAFPALVINPTFMFGAYDSKPGAGTMILAIYNQKVPGYTKGGRNFIYVKDVAIATANALSQGTIGECYIAGHVNMHYKEAFETIAEVVGVKAPSLPIPSFASKLYGRIGSAYGNLFRKEPKVSYPMAAISNDEHFFTAQKAVKELDMPQTDIKIAIKECFDWFKMNGYC